MLIEINYKKKLHKKSQTEKDLNCRNDLINEVKVLQNSLRKKIQLEKDNYYQKFFKENKNNLIQVWRNMKSLINFKSKAKHNNVNSLHIKEKSSQIPLKYATFLTNTSQTLQEKLTKKLLKQVETLIIIC